MSHLSTRHMRSIALGIGGIALTASVAIAGQGPSGGAASIAPKLDAAATHVSSARALQAIADAKAAAAAGLAKAEATGAQALDAATSAADARAAALAAAQAGLAKAMAALTNNPTDSDVGGLAGLTTASSAITNGLAHATSGSANAGSHPTGH